MVSSSSSPRPEVFADDRPFAPITNSVGFLHADGDLVVTAFLDWRTALGQQPVARKLDSDLASAFRSLLPLTSVDRRRFLFVATAGGWTAYFDNGATGTDAGPPMSYLAQQIGCRGLRVVSVPNSPRVFGATILEVYGAERRQFLNYERTISAANDGGRWRFDASGTPFPFEDLAAYERRRIRDRFTHDMLRDYLAALGVKAFEDDFYGAATLVERQDPVPGAVQTFTLEEARARYFG